VLLAASLVLVEGGCPLTDLPRLLTDRPFREGLLSRTSDAAVVSFFHDRFDRWGRDAPAMIESTLRRVFLLTFSPTLRYSLGATENLLQFRKFMDQGVSVLFDLGGLDEDTQRLLGCLLTVGFEVAALSRADTAVEKRRRYHLFIDEFAQFASQSEESLARVLSLCRKYGLSLVLAHQTWSQLSSRMNGALQNAVEIAFRLGRSDAEWAAPLFGRFDPLAVKHEVMDPLQVERTHPVFFSLAETFEEWTQTLADLRPREAYVKAGSKTALIRTLNLRSDEVGDKALAAVVEAFGERLLRPRRAPAMETRLRAERVTRFAEVRGG
jgi:hypothetical protein